MAFEPNSNSYNNNYNNNSNDININNDNNNDNHNNTSTSTSTGTGTSTSNSNSNTIGVQRICPLWLAWLRTNGVNTNGVAPKVMSFDRLGKKYATFTDFDRLVPKKSLCQKT